MYLYILKNDHHPKRIIVTNSYGEIVTTKFLLFVTLKLILLRSSLLPVQIWKEIHCAVSTEMSR